MNAKLTTADIATYTAKKSAENTITDRIDYIIKTIYATFDMECDTWYFDGAEEGEIGPMPDLDNDSIYGIVCEPGCGGFDVRFGDGSVVENLPWHIPTRWLYDDFEQELEDGKERYKQWKIDEAQKRKQQGIERAEKKQMMLDAIRAKLTPEEIKFLKIKEKR